MDLTIDFKKEELTYNIFYKQKNGRINISC